MFNNKAIEMDEWATAGPVESRRMAPGYVRRKRARSVIGCLFSMATILLTTGCTCLLYTSDAADDMHV